MCVLVQKWVVLRPKMHPRAITGGCIAFSLQAEGLVAGIPIVQTALTGGKGFPIGVVLVYHRGGACCNNIIALDANDLKHRAIVCFNS